MYTKRMTALSRSVSAAAIAMAISIGGAGIASASWHRSDRVDGAKCASARLSSFDYASGGVGGYVTAVSATSISVDQWNGTTATFTVDPSTTINVGTTTATIGSVVIGDRVRIGVASGGTTTAASVTVELAMLVGTVTTVSGNTITITDPQGFTRTILVGSATTYEVGGSTGSLSGVVVGAKIIARGTVDANGTSLDALSVDVGSAGSSQFTSGVITAVTGSTVTVQERSGTSATFTLTSTTLFKDGSLSLSLRDLVVGEHVGIETNSSAETTALRIDVQLAHAGGTVTAVSGSTLTVASFHGSSQTINVDSSTLYYAGRTASTLAAVVVGAHVIALGTVVSGSTSFDARYVDVWAPSISVPPSHGPVSNNVGNDGSHGNVGGGRGNFGRHGSGGGQGSHSHFARGGHSRR